MARVASIAIPAEVTIEPVATNFLVYKMLVTMSVEPIFAETAVVNLRTGNSFL